MTALRQTTLNLFAAGLFHLIEQQLAELCRDGTFYALPPSDTKLSVVADWCRKHFSLDLGSLASWPSIEQLRLIANSVKHGEGNSAAQLRTLRSELFHHPALSKLYPDQKYLYAPQPLRLPLAGEGLYVTEEVFAELSAAAMSFIAEIAAYFVAHAEDQYFVGD